MTRMSLVKEFQHNQAWTGHSDEFLHFHGREEISNGQILIYNPVSVPSDNKYVTSSGRNVRSFDIPR